MSFQSLWLFRLAAELEGKAAALRKEALQYLTIALAGSDTKELFKLLVTFFGKGTDVDPFGFIDGAPVIKRPLDLTDTESDSETGDDAASTSTTATTTAEPSTSTGVASEAPVTKPVKIKPKVSYPDKCVDIQDAIGFLPENSGTLHNTGIPEQFAVRCVGKNEHGTSIYSCPHPECSDPPYTGDIAGCGSHVQRVHLGRCVSCPFCPDRKYYNADGWRRHMKNKHNKIPWYSGDLQLPVGLVPSSSTSTDPVILPTSVSLAKDEDVPVETCVDVKDDPVDTLPYEEAADDDIPPDDNNDPPKSCPPTSSSEEIREPMEFLPSDTRDYDIPDTSRQAAHPGRAPISSTLSEMPEPEPGEVPSQCKRRKVNPPPDDDVPPSTG